MKTQFYIFFAVIFIVGFSYGQNFNPTPISFAGPKIFEMPLLGYLGFIPFAFEVYVMQEFFRVLFPSLTRLKNV